MTDKQFCRGRSRMASIPLQIQMEEMAIWLAHGALDNLTLDPVLEERLRQVRDVQRADTVNTPYKSMFNTRPGTDYGEGIKGRQVGQKSDEADEKDG
uniref:Uncharacterized protein n=1 Tax=Myoviridae sp. ctshb19 TaxID=2825194 RepID=A0A8S5UGY6_9CAUD|nr:MAG TPA: hypothetical protein [Myoviridae sp. ctshb19]